MRNKNVSCCVVLDYVFFLSLDKMNGSWIESQVKVYIVIAQSKRAGDRVDEREIE